MRREPRGANRVARVARRRVKLAARLAGAALLLASLAGCTGTFEATAPLLLAVGVVDGSGNPQVALVQDAFSPAQPTGGARLAFIDASRRALAQPAVDADVTDRDGQRDRLALLTRQLNAASPASELRFFDLSGIDPDDPVAFAASAEHPVVALSGSPGAVLDAAPGGLGACPSALQTSADGRYVAVLDDRGTCSGVASDLVTLYVIDVAATPPAVVFSSGAQPLLPAAPYLDQASPEEHLYYLVSGINEMLVYRLTLPDSASGSWSGSPYLGLAMPGTDGTALRADRDWLVSLGSQNLRSVEEAEDAEPASVGTVDEPRAMAVDDTGTTSQVVVVGAHETYVHADPTDDDPTVLSSVHGRAAVIDPLDRFAYVLREGVIHVIDLLAVSSDSPSASLSMPVPLPELLLPSQGGAAVGVLAWARAVTAPVP